MASINISGILGWGSSYNTDINGLIEGKVATLINYAMAFSGIVAVILLIVAGYSFITSAGDPDKAAQAGKMVTGTIIGLAIVLIAGILVKYILQVIGA